MDDGKWGDLGSRVGGVKTLDEGEVMSAVVAMDCIIGRCLLLLGDRIVYSHAEYQFQSLTSLLTLFQSFNLIKIKKSEFVGFIRKHHQGWWNLRAPKYSTTPLSNYLQYFHQPLQHFVRPCRLPWSRDLANLEVDVSIDVDCVHTLIKCRRLKGDKHGILQGYQKF